MSNDNPYDELVMRFAAVMIEALRPLAKYIDAMDWDKPKRSRGGWRTYVTQAQDYTGDNNRGSGMVHAAISSED